MKLSIIMPVFNEERTLTKIIDKVKSVNIEKELIIIDDGSHDRTKQILKKLNESFIKVVIHRFNRGKGAAIRTGLSHVHGDVVIIQDADLEYDPDDYIKLLKFFEKEKVDIVYGSRFLGKKKVTDFFHYKVNQFLTVVTNLLFASDLTDMETCYKLFRPEVIKGLNLESNGFEVEAELTIKALKKGYKIYEVPISYKSRSYHDGKKIGWIDGVKTLYCIFRYRLSN